MSRDTKDYIVLLSIIAIEVMAILYVAPMGF